MSLFNFNLAEVLSFFAVLVRFTTLFAVLPITGDRMVLQPLKLLLGMAVTLLLFPSLVRSHAIEVRAAWLWSSTVTGLVGTLLSEVLFALLLGWIAKLLFEGIAMSGHLVGTYMGFAQASSYDPHQETQTQIVAQLQSALAMLLFLALEGHHLMLQAALGSYQVLGLGQLQGVSAPIAHQLIAHCGEVLVMAVQLSAPVGVSLFAVNALFGMIGKAIPQLNILAISLTITVLVGLWVMLMTLGESAGIMAFWFEKIIDWLNEAAWLGAHAEH